jgi:hypothetical protein
MIKAQGTAGTKAAATSIMDDGLMKDEATAATAAAHGAGATQRAAVWRLWWRQLSFTTKLVLGVSLGVALLASYRTVRFQKRQCRAYALQVGSTESNDDSFALSMARCSGGWLYSYKQGSTGTTKGPRILLLLDIWYSGYKVSSYTKEYGARYEADQYFPYTAVYEFELSIGQDANGDVVWMSSEDGNDNVEIEPSVVHLSFSNGATNDVYNDSVFFISYAFTGNEMQVEQRAIDLSGISTKCAMKRLFQRNADLAAFDAQWRTGTYSLPDDEYYSKENDPN